MNPEIPTTAIKFYQYQKLCPHTCNFPCLLGCCRRPVFLLLGRSSYFAVLCMFILSTVCSSEKMNLSPFHSTVWAPGTILTMDVLSCGGSMRAINYGWRAPKSNAIRQYQGFKSKITATGPVKSAFYRIY